MLSNHGSGRPICAFKFAAATNKHEAVLLAKPIRTNNPGKLEEVNELEAIRTVPLLCQKLRSSLPLHQLPHALAGPFS